MQHLLYYVAAPLSLPSSATRGSYAVWKISPRRYHATTQCLEWHWELSIKLHSNIATASEQWGSDIGSFSDCGFSGTSDQLCLSDQKLGIDTLSKPAIHSSSAQLLENQKLPGLINQWINACAKTPRHRQTVFESQGLQDQPVQHSHFFLIPRYCN